jgi:hypothetical protein
MDAPDPRDLRIAELEAELAAANKRIEQLERQLQKFLQRGNKHTPKTPPKQGTPNDRRRTKHRKHPGVFRPEPPKELPLVEHEVHAKECQHCGSRDLEDTGDFQDHFVVDIPEPKLEQHRYRRYFAKCKCCEKLSQGRGDLELPGSHIGPRARLLTCYAKAHLGISLGKTQDLLKDYFALDVSRAGLLGHLKWGGNLFEPVVDALWEKLRNSPVVQGDETGWRINGQTAWAWCFRDPKLALFLIDKHRSRAVIEQALGSSFSGTLVSDFYAAYHGIDCTKQRCLVHLLRELAKLRDSRPWQSVQAFLQPLITLFQDAIQLGKDRETFTSEAFATAKRAIVDRFDDLLLAITARTKSVVAFGNDWLVTVRSCLRFWTMRGCRRTTTARSGTFGAWRRLVRMAGCIGRLGVRRRSRGSRVWWRRG